MDWFLYDNGLPHERVKGIKNDFFVLLWEFGLKIQIQLQIK